MAYPDPTYSLYPVLAGIQDARVKAVPLDDSFELPEDFIAAVADAALLFLARPNAPTGNCFDREMMHAVCGACPGIVWIDEAYADFAEDNCLDFPRTYENVVVSRSFSKSYSLAGARLGLAFANPALIAQMTKVKDSYNVNRLTQALGLAALRDQAAMQENAERIRATRRQVSRQLAELRFKVLPSQANFIFAVPPMPAEQYLAELRRNGILIRHFPGPRTGRFVRISIGTEEEMAEFVQVTRRLVV